MDLEDTQDGLVMFVDIARSTLLYEQLGEVAAFTKISSCLAHLGDIVRRNNGVIVKHIGDEVLCYFSNLVEGFQAGVIAQLEMSTSETLSGLPVRIGCHYGPILHKDDDIFGDTVNVSAHLASLAQAKQILTSDTCLKHYEAELAQLIAEKGVDPNQIASSDEAEDLDFSKPIPHRFLTRFRPKGKQYQIDVHSVIWEGILEERISDWTFVQSLKAHKAYQSTRQIVLKAQSNAYVLDTAHPRVTVGRGPEADIRLDDGNVSRHHGTFLLEGTQCTFTDQSSNGSYLSGEEGVEQFIHRKSIVLGESGQISCGQTSEFNDVGVIEFSFVPVT